MIHEHEHQHALDKNKKTEEEGAPCCVVSWNRELLHLSKGAFAPTGDCSHLISTGFGMEKKRMGLGLGLWDVRPRCDLFSWRMTEVLGSCQSYLFPCIFHKHVMNRQQPCPSTAFHLSPSQTNSWETVGGIKGRSAIP